MAVKVVFGEDPGWMLREAGAFLASDPVRHNLILTLLRARVAYPEPGRYWLATDGSAVVGVAFQSPLDFVASVTPANPEAVAALVEEIVEAGIILPGVNGEAATAARFAGQWTERRGSAAFPVEGQRISLHSRRGSFRASLTGTSEVGARLLYSIRVVTLAAWFSKPSRRARRSTWGPRSCRAFWVKCM
jgi:hypothetical protein